MNIRQFIKFGTLLVIASQIMAAPAIRNDRNAMFFRARVAAAGGGGGGTAFIVSGHGTSRNNFSGNVGYSFVPAADMTITSLGRIAVSGNSGSHTVYLISQDGGTILAQATVSMAGATAGTYVYGSITPTAITVAGAGALGYIIVSSETSGDDAWYDSDATLTTTAAATLYGSRYFSGAGYSTFNTGSVGFVPPNFTYTVP